MWAISPLKTVQDTRVGDTVTLADNPAAEALPGYRKMNPMVYCGLYPLIRRATTIYGKH